MLLGAKEDLVSCLMDVRLWWGGGIIIITKRSSSLTFHPSSGKDVEKRTRRAKVRIMTSCFFFL